MNTAHSSAPSYIAPEDPPSKQEILKAALRLFARDGVGGTSVRAIADESGYTNPALFKFFASKEALALHLFEHCYLRLAADLEAAIRPERPFKKNLGSVLHAYAACFDEQADAFLFVQDHLREYWPKMPNRVRRKSMIAQLAQLLEQGVREGAVDPKLDRILSIAALTGFMAQFARMAYFGEIKGKSGDRVPEMEALIHKMLTV